jgi:hypothetical protein
MGTLEEAKAECPKERKIRKRENADADLKMEANLIFLTSLGL